MLREDALQQPLIAGDEVGVAARRLLQRTWNGPPRQLQTKACTVVSTLVGAAPMKNGLSLSQDASASTSAVAKVSISAGACTPQPWASTRAR
jgi:hypothetical protein